MPKTSIVSVVSFNYTQYYLTDDKTVYKNSLERNNIVQKNVVSMEICSDNQHIKYKTDVSDLKLDELPNEIIDMIYDKLDLESQIAFRSVSKKFYKFKLTNFWNMKKNINITNKILQDNMFIKRLDLSNNKNIKTVENLLFLIKLDVCKSNVVKLYNLPNLKKIYLDKKIKLPNVNITVIRCRPVKYNSSKRNSLDNIKTSRNSQNRYNNYIRRKSSDAINKVNNDVWLTNYYNYLNKQS